MRAIYVLVCFIFSAYLKAQSPPYRLFTIHDGLSQMKITSLHLDKRGYLWIGTRNGLNKFDGHNFSVYTEADGLPHNRIHALAEDSNGNIVILTYNGISIFDGSKFLNFPHPFTSVLFDLAIDKNNSIWICEKYTNPVLYKFENGTYKTIIKNKGILHLQYHKQTDQLLVTSEQSIYQIINDTLQVIDKGGYFFYPTSGDVNDQPFFVKDDAREKNKSILHYLNSGLPFPVAYQVNEKFIPHLQDIKANAIWNSIRNQLDLPDNGNGRIVLKNEFPITNDVLKDKNNQFWIGSENGLGQVYNPAFQSIPSNVLSNVWSVIEDEKNNMWFATYGNGMFNRIGNKKDIIRNPEAKALYYFACSAKDKKGRLYFGSNKGLEMFENGKSKLLWTKNTVFAIFYNAKNDEIVFGTDEGIGLIQNGKIKLIGENDGIHNNHYIQSIGQDKFDHYWLGSYSGLSKYDAKTGTIKNYTSENGLLPCQGVYCSIRDKKGNFWLGGDYGLMRYDDRKDCIDLVKSNNISGMIKSMIELNDSTLMIGTKDGLFLFNSSLFVRKNELDIKIINASNGYNGIDPGFMGLYKNSEGKVWICSSTSIDILDINNLLLDHQSLKSMITHLNGAMLPFHHHKEIIKISYGESNVVLKFEGIGFTRPAKTKYQYRLNEGNWTEWSEENEVILKDLNNGIYKFEVRAGPADNILDATNIDSVQFKISLPFYKSSWFPPLMLSLAFALLMISLIYYIRQYRTQKKYKQQMEEAKYLRSQLLLSHLNPHFIFNVLANIQNKIIFGKKEEASNGIVTLSKLLRNFLNASYKGSYSSKLGIENEIPLSTEIELLKAYIEFERDKNDFHFDFFIDIPDGLIPDNHSLPPLLLQPFVENAIKHGLLLQEKKGNLWLRFRDSGDGLVCRIEDDGVGLERALELRKHIAPTHVSLGSKIVKERISILNEMGYHIELQIFNRNPQGTIVEILIKE